MRHSLRALPVAILLAVALPAAAGDLPPAVSSALPGITLPADASTAPAATAGQPAHAPAPLPAINAPSRATVYLKPGVNEIIPISRGHLNRIVTPFVHPVVNTTSKAKISTDGSVMYVASTAKGPVTMYVRPKGREDLALSLTLLPQGIPPREIDLRIKGSKQGASFDLPRASNWESERPYVETIKDVMRKLALGQIPPGYGFSKWKKGDMGAECSQPTLTVTPGQALEGANMLVTVAKAVNTSKHRVEFDEADCQHKGVLAVAAWPRVSLAPGQATEVYIIHKRPSKAAQSRKRPSLLDGSK